MDIQEIIDKIDNKLDLVADVFGCKTNDCWEDLCEAIGDLTEELSKQTDTEVLGCDNCKIKNKCAKDTITEACYK